MSEELQSADDRPIQVFPGRVPTTPGETMNWYGFKLITTNGKSHRLALYEVTEGHKTPEMPMHFVLTDLTSLDNMIEQLQKVRPIYAEHLRRAGKLPEDETRRITV